MSRQLTERQTDALIALVEHPVPMRAEDRDPDGRNVAFWRRLEARGLVSVTAGRFVSLTAVGRVEAARRRLWRRARWPGPVT